MRLGFIGMGFVGGNTAKVLEEHHDILAYDKYKEPYTDPSILKDAEAIFLSVPTPMKPSGEIDYSPIHNSLETINKIFQGVKDKPLVIIRSTAVSGTTETLEKQYSFNFVFNPEFLREATALEDMRNTDRVVIGANREEDFDLVESIYKPVFPNANYIRVNTKTAEMIKYAANVLLSMQIASANELFQICKAVGVDYDEVKNAILLDNRVGRNIDVPGPDGLLGFGGKCFPKDLNALIYLARDHQYRPYLLEEAWRLNLNVRPEQDWFDIPGATSKNKKYGK